MTKKRNPTKKSSNYQQSYFDAERILEEKKVGGKLLYLIKWSGHDRNGKPWSPDWVRYLSKKKKIICFLFLFS
jgi:hypothetical protein